MSSALGYGEMGWITFTRILEVGPEDHLLREGEYAEPAALQGRVEVVARVGDEPLTLVDPQSNEADPRPVDQSPPVGGILLPADLPRVLPQQLHLLGNTKARCFKS